MAQEILSLKEQIEETQNSADEKIEKIKNDMQGKVNSLVKNAMDNPSSLSEDDQWVLFRDHCPKEEDIINLLNKFKECPKKLAKEISSHITHCHDIVNVKIALLELFEDDFEELGHKAFLPLCRSNNEDLQRCAFSLFSSAFSDGKISQKEAIEYLGRFHESNDNIILCGVIDFLYDNPEYIEKTSGDIITHIIHSIMRNHNLSTSPNESQIVRRQLLFLLDRYPKYITDNIVSLMVTPLYDNDFQIKLINLLKKHKQAQLNDFIQTQLNWRNWTDWSCIGENANNIFYELIDLFKNYPEDLINPLRKSIGTVANNNKAPELTEKFKNHFGLWATTKRTFSNIMNSK